MSPSDGSIVIADSSNHRVQIFDRNGNFLSSFGSYGQQEGEFDCLAGVALNQNGDIVICDRYNHRVQVFDGTGRFKKTFGSEGRADGQLSYPWGVTCDDTGLIYVCDKENHRIQVFKPDGTLVRKFGSLGQRPGQFENPHHRLGIPYFIRRHIETKNHSLLKFFKRPGIVRRVLQTLVFVS